MGAAQAWAPLQVPAPLPQLSLQTGHPVLDAIPASALIGAALVLIALAGLATALATALAQLSHARAEDLVEDGLRGAPAVMELVTHRRRARLTCRALEVLSVTLAVICLTLATFSWLPSWGAALGLTTLLSTVLVLFIDGMVAVQAGRTRPEKTALWLAGLLRWPMRAARLGRPLVRLLGKLVPPPAVTDAEARQVMVSDLREMVDDLGEDESLQIQDEDRELLRSVFEMGSTLVREVVVPRTEMVTIDKDATLVDALALVSHSGFSRIPVTGEDSDDIRGVIYLKDIVHWMVNRADWRTRTVQVVMREPTLVAEMVRVDDLMRQMQAGGAHLALVFDEWGGIVGLVTIEDLIEELVGEVTDEHDRREVQITQLAPSSWRIPARMPLSDLEELFDIDIDEDDVDTAGGLLAKALGKVPLLGDQADAWGINLRCDAVDGRRRQASAIVASRLDEATKAKES